jgi:hypothetical protein
MPDQLGQPADSMRGTVLHPCDDGYDQARRVWNGRLRKVTTELLSQAQIGMPGLGEFLLGLLPLYFEVGTGGEGRALEDAPQGGRVRGQGVETSLYSRVVGHFAQR